MASIYPFLDESGPPDYRLGEIARLQDELKAELANRSGLFKKYRRAGNVFEIIDGSATALGVILGGTGTILLASAVGAPIAPILMGVAAGCGLLSAGTKICIRRLKTKADKHNRIGVLAESKLNSIAEIVSKAMEDGKISHEEFQLVLKEVARYHLMKRESQQKKGKDLNEEALIKKGRDEALRSLVKKFESP